MNQRYPYLYNFLGGYFNEDWDLDSANWQDIVQEYKRKISSDDLKFVLQEIEDLLRVTPDERALKRQLFYELGCYYDPRPDLGGPTYHEWLSCIADLLRFTSPD